MPTHLTLIQSRIFEVRGQRVMLDFHLAEMYGVETRTLKQAVKRNIKRFPSDFMFELTQKESQEILSQGISQLVIPPTYNFGLSTPMAFTEQGVAQLSSVIRSDTAIEINISIVRAFVHVRQLLLNPTANQTLENRIELLEQSLNDILTDQNEINEDNRLQLELINQTLAEMQAKTNNANKPRKRIGYEGGEL